MFGNNDFDEDDRYQKDVNDILPDTNIDRDRTLSGKWALGLLCLAVLLTTVAFVAPNWVEGDPRFYGNKLDKVGLWVHCFRSIPDYNDQRHQRYFAGCRWIFNPFTPGYAEIRNYLVPRKLNIFKKLLRSGSLKIKFSFVIFIRANNDNKFLPFSFFRGNSILLYSFFHRYSHRNYFSIDVPSLCR